jgi:hypothetical protein
MSDIFSFLRKQTGHTGCGIPVGAYISCLRQRSSTRRGRPLGAAYAQGSCSIDPDISFLGNGILIPFQYSIRLSF